MKQLLAICLLISQVALAETKISQLPLLGGAAVGTTDSVPFVSVSNNETAGLHLVDIALIPGTLSTFSSGGSLPVTTSDTLQSAIQKLNAAAVTVGMTKISSVTISGSSTTNVTFSSIPQTYSTLKLLIVAASANSSSENIVVQFNGDTGSHYVYIMPYSFVNNGSSSGSIQSIGTSVTGEDVSAWLGFATGTNTSNWAGYQETVFPFYASTTFYKQFSTTAGHYNGTGIAYKAVNGFWESTSAVSSMVLKLQSGLHFMAGSQFILYGIL